MPHFDVVIEGVNCRISLLSLWKIPPLLLRFTKKQKSFFRMVMHKYGTLMRQAIMVEKYGHHRP